MADLQSSGVYDAFASMSMNTYEISLLLYGEENIY